MIEAYDVLSDAVKRQKYNQVRVYRGAAPRFTPTPRARPPTAIAKVKAKPKTRGRGMLEPTPEVAQEL